MKITFLMPPALKGKAPERIFGCLVDGTLVFGNPSVKPIESISVGDKVLTHDGSYENVTFANMRKVNEKIIKIRVKHGTSKLITKEHPVLTYKGNKFLWVPSGDLNVGDRLAFPIDREVVDTEKIVVDNDIFHDIKEISKQTNNISEISRKVGVSRQCVRNCLKGNKVGYKTKSKIPYEIPVTKDLMLFFGYYLAEGSVSLRSKKGGEIVFSFNEKEKQYHEDVIRITKNIFGLNAHMKKEKSKCVTIHIHSKPLAEFLIKNLGTGSKEKRMEKWILKLPLEKQKELIKGLFRGDGYIDKHLYEITTTSRLLAFQVKQILLRFNILCSINYSNAKDGRQWIRIRISGKFIDIFNKIVDIKHPDSLKRKNINIEFLNDYALIPIIQKEEVQYKGNVFNIEVNGKNSYVLDDFIVHNCNYGLFYQPNIFILYPAAMLEKKGHKVVVLDCPLEKISWDKLKDYLKNDNSDLYVFYTVFLAEETDRHAAELIRETVGNVPIIFMGPEPTSRPSDFTLDENTFVARGEAEYTIMDFVDNIKSKNFKQIKGLTWMDDGKIVHNPPRELIKDLDKLPFPDRHLIKKELYYNPKLQGRPSTVMLTSRNCYGRCIYCIPCSYMFAREIEHKRFFNCKPPVRVRSPKNIYEEFKLVKKQGYKAIAIIDDNFLGLKGQEERITKLCELIKPLKMEWGCLARADQLQNEEVIKSMAAAGCVYVDIGAESFDQKVLDFVHKDLKVGDIFNAIFLLKKYGIEPKINILFGTSPYETEESIKWTVKMLKELNIDWVSFDVTIPHPNTEFYKIVKNNKWFATKSKDFEPVDVIREATVNFPNLNHDKLRELVKWAYREYYLRPQYIWKRLLKVRGFQDFKELVQTAWRLFF